MFQDRTYTFQVLMPDGKDGIGNQVANSRPSECDGQLYNLNVRGKRGNIVQTYPSVEYDFVPNKMTVTEDDCVHLQWTGSDYNPNRNPNNGEGGPPNPNNSNEGKSDRTNMVQMGRNGYNFPLLDSKEFTMFKATDTQWRRMTFLDQPLNSQTECLTATELDNAGVNNRQDRERDHRNCGKLSGQKIPHMDIGVVKAGSVGTYEYMSTRNNNLSNRGQKGTFTVTPSTKSKLSTGATVGIVIASLVVVGAAGAAGMMYMKKSGRGGGSGYLPQHRASSGGGAHEAKALSAAPQNTNTVVAKHQYKAAEAGELSFNKGDTITVIKRDGSGWWTGRANGQTGVFPSNYVS